jgi:A/G-specific adenine glycosylase
VGRYTAGAIGSIAFDLPEPIVDGNVARVLSRVLAIETPLGTRETERRLWQAAEELAKGERPGALNQALMELGARVCLPQRARCDACPLAQECRALREDKVDALPVAKPKLAPRAVQLVALAALDAQRRVWLQRGEGDLFGGLWGLPSTEGERRSEVSALAERLGFDGTLAMRSRASLRHVLTHRVLEVRLYVMRDACGRKSATLQPVALSELNRFGTSTLTRKLLERVG